MAWNYPFQTRNQQANAPRNPISHGALTLRFPLHPRPPDTDRDGYHDEVVSCPHILRRTGGSLVTTLIQRVVSVI